MSEYQKIQEVGTESTLLQLYSDLDGCFLDHQTYSYSESLPALQAALNKLVLTTFVSSKTEAEMRAIYISLGINGQMPIIYENAGGIIIPKTIIDTLLPLQDVVRIQEESDSWHIHLADSAEKARMVVQRSAQKAGIPITLLNDMTAEEFAQMTGLTIPQATMAMLEQHKAGFIINLPDSEKLNARIELKQTITSQGYGYGQGQRLETVTAGMTSKGKGVRMLRSIIEHKYNRPSVALGLGDAPADGPLVDACDIGVYVANPYGKAVIQDNGPRILKFPEVGPAGWNKAVSMFINGEMNEIVNYS